MCDAYARDVNVILRMQTSAGGAVEGGKEELCNHMKTPAPPCGCPAEPEHQHRVAACEPPASLDVCHCQMRQTSTLQMRGGPAMTEVSDRTYVVKRHVRRPSDHVHRRGKHGVV